MPKDDKQKACQPKPELSAQEKELRELTKAMIDFLKAMRDGELEHD